jgi:peptide deformylase
VRVVIAQMPDSKFRPFINPMIVSHSSKTIDSTEGCMSLKGTRTVKRYTSVTVMYQNLSGKWNKETFTNFTAIELQHEIDHTNGILI